jgi:hypothetical protein
MIGILNNYYLNIEISKKMVKYKILNNLNEFFRKLYFFFIQKMLNTKLFS